MTAITGESLFYEVARIINNDNPISYYQYRALGAFVETLVLHDNAIILVGEETDDRFIKEFEWLIETIQKKSDYRITRVTNNNRGEFIRPEEIRQFQTICGEVYRNPIGITSDDLFMKQRKDRTSEDMAERIERIFCQNYPELDCQKVADDLYTVWLKNANSSELLYFLRGHLLQAMAELRNSTPIFENQRLIVDILQKRLRGNNRVGTLAFTIYSLVNTLFIQASNSLAVNDNSYPSIPLFLSVMVEKLTDRSDFIDATLILRSKFKEFRSHYQRIEQELTNPNVSLKLKSELKERLKVSLEKVWMPTVSSFGRNYTSGRLKKGAKAFFGKYGIGDLKISGARKGDTSDDSISYSTPSLFGFGTALVQTISEIHKDSNLYKPDRALLDVLQIAIEQSNTKTGLLKHLPIRKFNYQIYRLLDSNMIYNPMEVTK